MTAANNAPAVRAFRTKLVAAMMLIVSVVAGAGLLFAQKNVADNVRRDFQRQFQEELASMHATQEARRSAVAERCRALARRPRIHAALEDGATDLLYPSARDELADVMGADAAAEPGEYALRARFYRFLDSKGAVIEPPSIADVGPLTSQEEARLALPSLPDRPQTGYLPRPGRGTDEVIAMPIVSSENGDLISAIVLGFGPPELGIRPDPSMVSGIWLDGRLDMPGFPQDAASEFAAEFAGKVRTAGERGSIEISRREDSSAWLLFYERLNPDSLYPPAYGVSAFSLAGAAARQRTLAWQFAGVWLVLVAGAFAASHLLSGRLSRPVEQLAVDSEANRAGKVRAEAALESTSRELQRSARFSADASHQLKTPVAVLRAGLEELLAGNKLPTAEREHAAALVHQTFRLASVIDDLLLLSRMDAGRLQIQFSRLDLAPLIAGIVDDIGAVAEDHAPVADSDVPDELWVSGERRYVSLILQNLVENARKYNVPGGRIRIAARIGAGAAVVAIGNTGRGIAQAAQEHIFERFHRGSVGEDIPGHGIGLNLARELARLHGGELRLSRSDAGWTEFELVLCLADRPRDHEVS